MRVTVTLFQSAAKLMDVPEGAKAKDIAPKYDPRQLVFFVSGRLSVPDTVLREGDNVGVAVKMGSRGL